jgi:hypothetical protein
MHASPFLHISGNCQHTYIGLHIHLLNIALLHSWDHAKSELTYHMKKLREIRALYQTQLQVLVHNYCYYYLRDLVQTQKWQMFGIQDLHIQELEMSMGFIMPSKPTARGNFSPLPLPATAGCSRYCNHCKMSLHAGNKASCF